MALLIQPRNPLLLLCSSKGETFDIFYFIQRSLEVTKVAHSVGGSRLSFSHNLGTYCLGGEGRKKFLFINRFPLRFYQRSNSRKHHQRTVHCTAIPTLFLTHLVNVVFSGGLLWIMVPVATFHFWSTPIISQCGKITRKVSFTRAKRAHFLGF